MHTPRLIVAALFCGIVGLGPACAGQGKPDFSGHWELVKSKSDFGKASKPVGMTLVSENRDGSLHSVQTTQTASGDQTTESDWQPDGQRHAYQTPVPGYSITRWDGNTLVNERRSNDGQYRETIKLAMESDGKTATETVASHTPDGDNHLKLVWQRK